METDPAPITVQEMHDQFVGLSLANNITVMLAGTSLDGDQCLSLFDTIGGEMLSIKDPLPPGYTLETLLAEFLKKYRDMATRYRHKQSAARAREDYAVVLQKLVQEEMSALFLTTAIPEASSATPIGGETDEFVGFVKIGDGIETVYAVQWKNGKPFAAARVDATAFGWAHAPNGIGPRERHGMFWTALAREFLARKLFDGNLPSDLNVLLVPAVKNFPEPRDGHELYSVAGAVFSRHSGGTQYHVVFENGLPVRVTEVQP